MRRIVLLGLILVLVSVTVSFAQEPATPIPGREVDEPIEMYIGAPATASPIDMPSNPEHPYMAPNPSSNMHHDAYMSDVYMRPGPLGHEPEVLSSFLEAVCPTMAFDSEGRIITVCLFIGSANLYVIDPVTLAPLTNMELPMRTIASFTDFPAGSYFYLDQDERIILPTVEHEILVIVVEDGPAFEIVETYDLSTILDAEDSITSILPDTEGNLWFLTRFGVVGTIVAASGDIATLETEENVANSFATDETGGVFIVTDFALYRFDADENGVPTITWREEYDRGSVQKSGQASQGSGTTPTLMGQNYIVITDNADPRMNVLVYQRGVEVDGERLVCSEPVFGEGQSSTENSIIATDRSMIVENNYGYVGPLAPLELENAETRIGMARIDLNEDGTCQTVWTSNEIVPSVVSKMSVATGLIYTYTKDEGPSPLGAWYFTAIDFETGETVFKQYTGTGAYFNNHYAGLYLGPDGTTYIGVVGGIVAIRDTE